MTIAEKHWPKKAKTDGDVSKPKVFGLKETWDSGEKYQLCGTKIEDINYAKISHSFDTCGCVGASPSAGDVATAHRGAMAV